MLAWVVLLWGCGAPSPEVEPTPELSVAPVPVEAPVPPEPEEPLPRGGNVLVLLIDDVGVDKVGAYGGGYAARTPRIDALASQGIRFTNAYAAPMCSPSRAILLTGRYGRRTGIGTITEKESNGSELPLDAVTIPEALDFATGATWTNAAIGKWHLAGPAAADWKTHPNRQGFDWFVGTRGNPEYKEGRGYFHWPRNVNGVIADSDTYMTTATVDDALRQVKVMPEPWFMYVAFNAPHVPIHEPPPALVPGGIPKKPSTLQKYDAMLEALDTEIGRLVDGIDPAMLGRTTVFLLGDNGTSKWGMPKNRGPGASRAKHSVFEGGVRIPLVVTGPLVKSPGTTDDSLVHIADLFPTVVDIAGLPRAEGRVDAWQLGDQTVEVDGRSLLPLLQGRPGTREYLYTEGFEPNGPGPYTQDLRAVRNGTHKLMQRGSAYGLFRIEGLWEGNDLMSAPLSPEDQAAHDALLAELDRWKARLRYEGR